MARVTREQKRSVKEEREVVELYKRGAAKTDEHLVAIRKELASIHKDVVGIRREIKPKQVQVPVRSVYHSIGCGCAGCDLTIRPGDIIIRW